MVAPPEQQEQPDEGNATATKTVHLRPCFHAAPSWDAARSETPARTLHAPTAEPSEFSWDRERGSGGGRAPDAHRSQAEQAHGHRGGSGGREERGRPDGELTPQEDAGDSCGRTREP
jgi:hypothetical protein